MSNYSEQLLAAKVARLEREAERNELELFLATGEEMRSLSFYGELTAEATGNVVKYLSLWEKLDREKQLKKRLHLTIDSLGGSTVEYLALFDFIKRLRERGHEVVGQVRGSAGLHAVTLLQACSERVISDQSWLLLAEEDLMRVHGNTSTAQETITWLRSLEQRGWGLVADRTGGKLTAEEIFNRTRHKQQWWLPAEESLRYGLVDKVGDTQPDPMLPQVDPELMPKPGDSLEDRKAKAQIRIQLAKAAVTELQSEKVRTMTNVSQFSFFFPVLRETCLMASKALEIFSRKPGQEIEIIINSPGGSVMDGLGVIDSIYALRKQGFKVTTKTYGMAASMGGFLLQAGDERVMAPNASLLIHEISRMFVGGISEVLDQQTLMEELQKRAFPLLAQRSKLSVEEVLRRCERKDWWMPAEEALEYGFIDRIGY